MLNMFYFFFFLELFRTRYNMFLANDLTPDDILYSSNLPLF